MLPLLKSEPATLYTANGSKLLPSIEAHMDRLREYDSFQVAILAWAECLQGRLATVEQDASLCRTQLGITPM